VELLVNGVVNVMRHLGMIAAEHPHLNPLPNKGEEGSATVLTKFEWVYTKSAGMWYPKVSPGDVVNKGEEIGKVGDLFGDTLEEIVSPVNGVVLFLTINPSVLENGLLMGIGAA
jgi:predicted deacylase